MKRLFDHDVTASVCARGLMWMACPRHYVKVPGTGPCIKQATPILSAVDIDFNSVLIYYPWYQILN